MEKNKPTRDHYNFMGWENKSGNRVGTFEVKNKLTLNATWEGKLYTITFGTYKLSDGTQIPEKKKKL